MTKNDFVALLRTIKLRSCEKFFILSLVTNLLTFVLLTVVVRSYPEEFQHDPTGFMLLLAFVVAVHFMANIAWFVIGGVSYLYDWFSNAECNEGWVGVFFSWLKSNDR